VALRRLRWRLEGDFGERPDGKESCSLAQHIESNLAWFPLLLVYFFPHIVAVGGIVYFVNDAVYRAVVQRRVRRWLED
jgi:hypothetical protein